MQLTPELKKKLGGVARIARACGISEAAVSGWKRIPAKHVQRVEELSGVSRHSLRRDVFGEKKAASDRCETGDAFLGSSIWGEVDDLKEEVCSLGSVVGAVDCRLENVMKLFLCIVEGLKAAGVDMSGVALAASSSMLGGGELLGLAGEVESLREEVAGLRKAIGHGSQGSTAKRGKPRGEAASRAAQAPAKRAGASEASQEEGGCER